MDRGRNAKQEVVNRGPEDWRSLRARFPRTAEEATWFRLHAVDLRTWPRPGLPMEEQPGRFVALFRLLADLGHLRPPGS